MYNKSWSMGRAHEPGQLPRGYLGSTHLEVTLIRVV